MADCQPHLLQQDPDGTYRWNCAVEESHYRKGMLLGFKCCAGISLGIIALGALFSINRHDWDTFWVILATAGGFLALCALIFVPLLILGKDPRESYTLCDTSVSTGYGKGSSVFFFRHARVMIVYEACLELRSAVTQMRVYVPAEDFDFVRDYIRGRLPEDAEVCRG